jgi:hypothetical protein
MLTCISEITGRVVTCANLQAQRWLDADPIFLNIEKLIIEPTAFRAKD